MTPPVCRLCHEAHWSWHPHRFPAAPVTPVWSAVTLGAPRGVALVATDKPKRETLKRAVETGNASPETGKCETCGDPFHPKRSDQVYCSAACRLKAHRRRV
jgi:hypothetical protein